MITKHSKGGLTKFRASSSLPGFTGTNVLTLLLCVVSFFVLLGSGVYYYNQKNEVKLERERQQNAEKQNLYFWEYVPMPGKELSEAIRTSLGALEMYFSTPSIPQKAGFVSNGFVHVGKMNRYYAENAQEVLLSTPKLVGVPVVFKVHDTPCLCLFLEFKNGVKWELNFFQDPLDRSWKLDWPAFTRYQSMDWKEFLYGKTPIPKGAEFRLWAQRDKTMEDKDHYAIRFIQPPKNGSTKIGITSEPIMVEKASTLGREFYKYYVINEMQDPAYRVLNASDDKSYIRMRVVLSKHTDELHPGKMILKLDRIISEGWYDDPAY